jgi:hypothetical protein
MANARRADERAEELQRRDYINRVNLALSECLGNNVTRALELLDGCPEDLRGWEWSYAERQCHLDLGAFRQSGETLNGVAFSPDGTRVASVSGAFENDEPALKGDLVVRDVATGQRSSPIETSPAASAAWPSAPTAAGSPRARLGPDHLERGHWHRRVSLPDPAIAISPLPGIQSRTAGGSSRDTRHTRHPSSPMSAATPISGI